MNEPYSILMQKTTENAPVKDSLAHFGIVCTEFPFKPGGETKDLPKRDWPEEDGEDTYIPDKLPLKAYDLEAEMCYKGDLGTAYDKIMAFQNYLTGENGDGATLKIYNSHTGIGRQGLYLSLIHILIPGYGMGNSLELNLQDRTGGDMATFYERCV